MAAPIIPMPPITAMNINKPSVFMSNPRPIPSAGFHRCSIAETNPSQARQSAETAGFGFLTAYNPQW